MQLLTIHLKVFVIFRRRRMKTFYSIFEPTAQTRMLDIGGAPNTWIAESRFESRFPVTLINLRFPDPAVLADGRFTAVEGDAAQLPFADASFDIVFSNSVIEHMTTWERQQALQPRLAVSGKSFGSRRRRAAFRWSRTS